jgi:hypothetical protein
MPDINVDEDADVKSLSFPGPLNTKSTQSTRTAVTHIQTVQDYLSQVICQSVAHLGELDTALAEGNELVDSFRPADTDRTLTQDEVTKVNDYVALSEKVADYKDKRSTEMHEWERA